MSAPATWHGTALVVGETGLLIRGPSGAGKTALALALVERASARGRYAALVADDRVVLEVHHGRLSARPPAALAGLAERRGRGILAVPHAPAAVVGLVVDLEETVARMPEEAAFSVDILGCRLARQPVPVRALAAAVPLAEAALAALEGPLQRGTALRRIFDCLLRSGSDW